MLGGLEISLIDSGLSSSDRQIALTHPAGTDLITPPQKNTEK